jgi:hypothetical protein
MPHILLKNTLIKRLDELGYQRPSHLKTPSGAWTLKSTILYGNADVEIKSHHSFEILITKHQFAECLYTDFYYGYERILKQNHCLPVLLKENNTPTAWSLVTAYYSAFFAAIEIGKILGRLNTYLEQRHCSQIQGHSNNSFQGKLEAGNYLGTARLDTHQGYVMIRFNSSGERPHLMAWKNLSDMFPISEGKNLSSARQQQIKLFKEIISNDSKSRWPTPSEVRNQWNYTNANYYGSLGEEYADVFAKQALSKRSCYSWAANKRLSPDEKNIANSIAFVNTVLLDVIENIKQKMIG